MRRNSFLPGVLAGCVATVPLVLGSCQSGYVIQQGWRQWRLSRQHVALDSPALLTSLNAEQKQKIEWVPRIMEFARKELGLDTGDSYTTYLDTGGQPLSHIVTASHPYALIPYQWCFPVVGCVTYKGYFDKEDADQESARLRADGWEVAVFEVAAYSTLGWFRDPLLSGTLDYELPHIIELVFHETTHRTLYLPGSVALNESLATHVAREGTRLFLDAHPEAVSEEDSKRYFDEIRFRDEINVVAGRLKQDLDTFYRRDRQGQPSNDRKREIFETSARARALLGLPETACPLSNAHVLASEQYHGLLPALAQMQEKAGGHPRNLMRYLKEICDSGQKLPPSLQKR